MSACLEAPSTDNEYPTPDRQPVEITDEGPLPEVDEEVSPDRSVNTPPEFEQVAMITPRAEIIVGTSLRCSANATDAEDGPLNTTFSWSLRNQEVSVEEFLVVTPDLDAVGETITCTALAQDSEGVTITSSDQVSVINTPPMITSVAITYDGLLYNDSTVMCDVTVTDLSDTPTYTVTWSLDNDEIGEGEIFDLSLVDASPGDILTCVVNAVDADGGSSIDNARDTILNRPPLISDITISPPEPRGSLDDLFCEAMVSDPDARPLIVEYIWRSDFQEYEGQTLPAVYTGSEQTWICEVTASDGIEAITATAETQTINACTYGICDFILNLGDEVQMEFNLIPAGEDPLGRYQLTHHMYMMTT